VQSTWAENWGLLCPFSWKGAQQPPSLSPCLLWPNGWMNQDATWYRVSWRCRCDIMLMGTQLPPWKGAKMLPHFSVHVWYGQKAGWIMIPLGTEVGLSPGYIVLDGVPAPLMERGIAAPTFWMSVVAKQSPIAADSELWYRISWRRRWHCVNWDSAPPWKSGKVSAALFGPCLLWPKGWIDQDTEVGFIPGDIVLDGDSARRRVTSLICPTGLEKSFFKSKKNQIF